MLRSAQIQEEDDFVGEIADRISEVGDAVVEAIQNIKFPAPKVEAKYEPNIQVTVPELKQPSVEVKAEMPKQRPHPFENGLVCEVIERDSDGKISKFTIKPIT